MYYRRKLILALFEAFGGFLTAKQFQKYLFLVTRKQEVKSFDFIPYYYGCFSFQANQDMSTLAKLGYLEIVESSTGRIVNLKNSSGYMSELSLFDQIAVNEIKLDFGEMSQADLIRFTYVNYPYFATKSVIAKDILTPEELAKVDRQKRVYEVPTLFTIGYEGKSLELYINSLILNDVRVLCDVRKNAYSQKYGFSKSQLEKACKGVNIGYIHIPELGIESDKRQNLCSQQDYDHLFDIYEKTTLVNNWEYVLKVRELIDTYGRIALTCFEKDPRQCHRSRIAAALMGLPSRKYNLKLL